MASDKTRRPKGATQESAAPSDLGPAARVDRQPPRLVRVVYRGPSDALVLQDGMELRAHEPAEASPEAVARAMAAGHAIEEAGPEA